MLSFRAKKVKNKGWQCNNQCKSNCCSEVFFKLTESNRQMFNKERRIVVNNDYADWDWVSFHRNLKVVPSGNLTIIEFSKDVATRLIWNETVNSWYLYVDDPCRHLQADNRCGIYDDRPNVCRITKCPVFESDEKIVWFGINGKLAKQRRDYVQSQEML